MPYTRTTWVDAPSTATPISAANLNNIEVGLTAAQFNYRKVTAKAVNTTSAATDLLNAEITIGAGVMGASGVLRLSAWGDQLDNVGAVPPRFQLLFGGTTFIDTNTVGSGLSSSATRKGWTIDAEIINVTASSQTCCFRLFHYNLATPGTQGQTTFTTGKGLLESNQQRYVGWGTNDGLSVNTASAQALVLNVINGSASASYETKLFGALVEIIT